MRVSTLSGVVIAGGIPVLACAATKRGSASTAKATTTARVLSCCFIASPPLCNDWIVLEREAFSAMLPQILDRGRHLASSPWRLRPMCPDTLIGGHGSGALTSAHLSTIRGHCIVYAAGCSRFCIWSDSPAIVMCRHLRPLAVYVRLYRQFCLTH